MSRKFVTKLVRRIFIQYSSLHASGFWPLATGHWLLASLRRAQPSRSEKQEARGPTRY
jgi:hypothetical protein